MTQNLANCQKTDSTGLETAIYIGGGTVVTPGSDKDAFGNFIVGAGCEQEIAARHFGNNRASVLVKSGLGYTYYDIQVGLQFDAISIMYLYAGAQFMMYYELGSSRNLIYDRGYYKPQPDRIITQFLPNFGFGSHVSDWKFELLSSAFVLSKYTIKFYFVFRCYFKI